MMKKSEVRILLLLLLVPSIAAVALWLIRVLLTDSLYLGFIVWNLILAWIPLIVSLSLVRLWRLHRLRHWKSLGLLALWFIFLPNTFYVVTDFIHLRNFNNPFRLLDIVILMLFSVAGLALGFISLLLVHKRLEKHFSTKTSFASVSLILLAASFAIYLGRQLRWNSWDVLVEPTGLIFDLSNRILYPNSHTDTFTITFLFFIFLVALYIPIWQLSNNFQFKATKKQR